VPYNDKANGTALVVGVAGMTVGMREAAVVGSSEAGIGVSIEAKGILEADWDDICVGTGTAAGIPQPIKIKTIKITKRETGIFFMVKYSNTPEPLLRLMVELDCSVFGS
jgi:hypothetical protein